MLEKPTLTDPAVNEACWKFIEECQRKGHSVDPMWANIKPIVHATICKYVDEINKQNKPEELTVTLKVNVDDSEIKQMIEALEKLKKL